MSHTHIHFTQIRCIPREVVVDYTQLALSEEISQYLATELVNMQLFQVHKLLHQCNSADNDFNGS